MPALNTEQKEEERELDVFVLNTMAGSTLPKSVRGVIKNLPELHGPSSDQAAGVLNQLIRLNFEAPKILNSKDIETVEDNIIIGREMFEECGKISLAMSCHEAGCPVTTLDDVDAVMEEIAQQWGKMTKQQRRAWSFSASAFNYQMVDDGRREPVAPFKRMNGYDIFCEQWPRMVRSTASTVNERFKQNMFNMDQQQCALVTDLEERWTQVPLEVRRYCAELARDRNEWKLCKEQGERETWECNPFRDQLDQATQSKQIQDVLLNCDTSRRDALKRNEQRVRLEREMLKPADEVQGESLAPGGIPKGFKRTDWSNVECTPENIAQGFKDADEYEAVRPDENWPDWMSYIPKVLRGEVCSKPSQLFPFAVKFVPREHPCFESIEERVRSEIPDDVVRKCFRDSLDNCHAPMDNDTFFVLRLVVTSDALTGDLGSKYKSAFDKGWVTSWKIGVTHPDRMAEWRADTEPHEAWKKPRVASEVVLTSKTHTGNHPTFTVAASVDPEWVEKNPPPSTRASNADWLDWFKKTWLAELITYHYEQIEERAGAVERIAKREQDARDAEEAAIALLEEEERERECAESKKAAKARKRQEAAARQAEEGKRAKEAAAAQKRAQEAARQAKIAAKHAANERALAEKRAAQKREEDAKFAKVLAEKQAREAKAAEEAGAAQRQSLNDWVKRRRQTECDALMARLGLQDASLEPSVQPSVQPSGRGGSRAGRGGRGGRGIGAPLPPPPATTEEDDKLCVICLDADKTHVCVPCGHRCLCTACAVDNKPSKCPVCRADVAVVWNGRVFE